MAKYIVAEKVIAALTDTLQYEGMVMDELISVVANIPAADVVERKKGEWLHEYLQTAVDFGIITETQASRLMDMIDDSEDNT